MRRSLVVTAALALSLIAGAARAQPASKDPNDAGAKFKSAQQLYDQRKYEQALPMFQEVDRALGSPNSLLYAARCLRELGRLPEAYHAMSRAMQAATERAHAEPSYVSTRDAAAAERAAIETTIARIIVAVVDPPKGLAVRINNEPADPARIGDIMAVAAGTVIVVVTAPDRASFRKELHIAAGASETIAVTLPAARVEPTAPRVAADTDTTDVAPEGSGGVVRTLGFVTAGVGVLGMATFAITGVMANARFSEIEEECGDPPCEDPAFTDRIHTGMALDTAANVGLIVGIAGILGGGAMIVFGGPKAAPPAANGAAGAGRRFTPGWAAGADARPTSGATLLASPRGASMTYRLRF